MKTIMWFVLVLSALSASGEVILLKRGEKAIFNCGVDEFSSSLLWYHGNNLLVRVRGKGGLHTKGQEGETVKRSSIAGKTSLQITGVQEEDAGLFTCIADGKSQKHTLLVMSVSVSPSNDLQQGNNATLTCKVKGLNPDPEVEWKRPDGSKPPGSNPISLSPVELSHNGIWVCMYSHAGTPYNESLEIRVKVLTTTTSPSQTSQKNASSDNRVPPSKSSDALGLLGLSWWMWVAVGVGGLVVVFLMVLVIVLCRRIKRRKRRLSKIRNAAQPLKPKQYCQCDHPTAAEKPQQGRRREKPY